MSTADETTFDENRNKFIESVVFEIKKNQKGENDQKVPKESKLTKTDSDILGLPLNLHGVCALVVKIILSINEGDQLGIGSGIVIKQDEASFCILTCHHVVQEYFDFKEYIKVVFTATGDHADNSYIYDVSSIDSLCPFDFLELNIKAGYDADISILKCLKDKTKVPINDVVRIPLQIPDFEKEIVYYIGYQNGSNLKWSSDYPVIRLGAQFDATQKGDLNSCSDQQIVSKYIQDDLMLTTIDTGAGCSGGGYFKSDGTFIALHIGKIKNDWKESLLLAEGCELHLSLFPQVPFRQKDWFKHLDLEKKNNPKANFAFLDFLEDSNYNVISSLIYCLDKDGKSVGRLITKEEAKSNEYRSLFQEEGEKKMYGSLNRCYEKFSLFSQEFVFVPILTDDKRIILEMTPTSKVSMEVPFVVNNLMLRKWRKLPENLQPCYLLPPHLFIVNLQTKNFLPETDDKQLALKLFTRFRTKGTCGSVESRRFIGYWYHHLTILWISFRTYFFAYHADQQDLLFVFGIGEHCGNSSRKYSISTRDLVNNTKDIEESFGSARFSQDRNSINNWIVNL